MLLCKSGGRVSFVDAPEITNESELGCGQIEKKKCIENKGSDGPVPEPPIPANKGGKAA